MIALAPAHRSQLVNYTSWLEKLEIPYNILTPNDNIDEKYSMLLLCGGPDVGKKGEEQRDTNDIKWFNQAYGKIPVLGVCRGLQLANVVLGGALHQDLDETLIKHTPNKVQTAGEPNPLMESSFHDILYDGRKIRVNSRHHQGISVLAEGLTVLATCEEDGLIEMTSGNNALFVQWHPERPDVWGTEAEQMVTKWVKERVTDKIDYQKTAIANLGHYYDSKKFTIVSEERIKKSINESYDSNFLTSLIQRFPHTVKRVTDKNGRSAIRLSNWKAV